MEEVGKNTLKRDDRVGMKVREENQIEHARTTEQTITEEYEGQLQLRDRRRTSYDKKWTKKNRKLRSWGWQ